MKILTGKENKILRSNSEEVLDINSEILSLEKKMSKIMKKSKGVGLAAPQIGILKRIILVKLESGETFMINPKIVSFSASVDCKEEGCLSIPETFGMVERYTSIKLNFLDKKGKQHEKYFYDFDARVIQHEIDHLNGVLFTDKIKENNIDSFLNKKELVI